MALPVTVIGGFLGSGKTTLLNNILRQAGNRRLAVLVNDFGAVAVDARIVATHAPDLIELTNGCICCSIGDDLSRTLAALATRAGEFDHMLIETSGIALPGAVADLVRLEPAFRLEAILVVANGATVLDQARAPYIGDTLTRQIAEANLILVSHNEELDGDRRRALDIWLAQTSPDAAHAFMSMGQVPLDLALSPRPSQSHVDTTSPHDVFQQWLFETKRPFARDRLQAAFRAMPSGLLRAKGIVHLDDGRGESHLLQAVGRRVAIMPIAAQAGDGMAAGRLVLIGTAMNGVREATEALLKDALAP